MSSWFSRVQMIGADKMVEKEDLKHKSKAVKEYYSCRLTLSMGITLNRGNYAFTKVDVEVTLPFSWNKREEVFKQAKEFLENKIQERVHKIVGREYERVGLTYEPDGICCTTDTLNKNVEVRYGRGETVPLANFESARIYLSCRMGVTDDNFDFNYAQDNIEKFVDETIDKELKELKAGLE